MNGNKIQIGFLVDTELKERSMRAAEDKDQPGGSRTLSQYITNLMEKALDGGDAEPVAMSGLRGLNENGEGRLPIGIAVLEGHDLIFRGINSHLAAINRVPVADHIGKKLTDIIPAAAEFMVPLIRNVMATGLPEIGRKFQMPCSGNTDENITLVDYQIPVNSEMIVSIVQDVTNLNGK